MENNQQFDAVSCSRDKLSFVAWGGTSELVLPWLRVLTVKKKLRNLVVIEEWFFNVGVCV
jgi:hypothetical protein